MTALSAADATSGLTDWVSRLADEVIAEANKRGTTVVCASGISPSGPVHLGNLREIMSPHLVADEIRRRGIPVEHIISWDDYDRFRRVPKGVPGVDESWEQYIGLPLTAVPAPPGSSHESWAAHFRAKCEESLAALGIDFRGISQTQMYTSGSYTEQILQAMADRKRIDEILEQYRTLPPSAAISPAEDDADTEAAALAAEGSGATQDEDGSSTAGYYPYKPYCAQCGKDTTTILSYDDVTTELAFTCDCGHAEKVLLREHRGGKLVWKVDWPMRWAYEKVVFEPSGVDHQSPGSSFVVGKSLAPLFDWQRPLGPMYAFVGIPGMAKMSSSRGGVPVPADALAVMEAPLLRWLYARKRMNQSFDIALDAGIQRMYDEWDVLSRKVSDGKAQAGEFAAYTRASSVADRALPLTPHPLPYRTLASVWDITTGDADQVLRIAGQLDPADPPATLDELQPRLELAAHWVSTMPDDERTLVRSEPDADALAAATDDQLASLRILLDGNGSPALLSIDQVWSLDGLTTQVYGVPKVQRGISADEVVKGNAELAAAQREFFKLLYRLLIGADTGPRLPTLLLAIGQERVRALLES